MESDAFNLSRALHDIGDIIDDFMDVLHEVNGFVGIAYIGGEYNVMVACRADKHCMTECRFPYRASLKLATR